MLLGNTSGSGCVSRSLPYAVLTNWDHAMRVSICNPIAADSLTFRFMIVANLMGLRLAPIANLFQWRFRSIKAPPL